MRSTFFLHANGAKAYQFKAKDSEIKPYLLRLEHISKVFIVNNMKKSGLNGKAYNFPFSYEAVNTSAFVNIQRYLIRKHNIV